MEIDFSPLLLTYFMMDWPKVSQEPSETRCLSCGALMMRVEAVKDKKRGGIFDGLVCHKCKTILWARRNSNP